VLPAGQQQAVKALPLADGLVTRSVPAVCVDRRKFAFRVHQPRGGRVVTVVAFVDGKRVKRLKAKRVSRITLKRLPRGLFTVRIVATTDRGSRTVSVRTYRGCTKSRPTTHVIRP
jgi:hypothetical protein